MYKKLKVESNRPFMKTAFIHEKKGLEFRISAPFFLPERGMAFSSF